VIRPSTAEGELGPARDLRTVDDLASSAVVPQGADGAAEATGPRVLKVLPAIQRRSPMTPFLKAKVFHLERDLESKADRLNRVVRSLYEPGGNPTGS
jgi:hypothetical protein